jgi:hypothetical protein
MKPSPAHLKALWSNYADRLVRAERKVAAGQLHPDNWLDLRYAPSGERWPEWVLAR